MGLWPFFPPSDHYHWLLSSCTRAGLRLPFPCFYLILLLKLCTEHDLLQWTETHHFPSIPHVWRYFLQLHLPFVRWMETSPEVSGQVKMSPQTGFTGDLRSVENSSLSALHGDFKSWSLGGEHPWCQPRTQKQCGRSICLTKCINSVLHSQIWKWRF